MKTQEVTTKEYYALYFADGSALNIGILNVSQTIHYPDEKILTHNADVNEVIKKVKEYLNVVLTVENFETDLEKQIQTF